VPSAADEVWAGLAGALIFTMVADRTGTAETFFTAWRGMGWCG
jgi:hypothetical protein